MSASRVCIVCDQQQFTEIYSGTLLKCGACGFITANMEMDAALLKKIYAENYFKGEEYMDYLSDKPILQLNFSKRLQYVLGKKREDHMSSVLEIGCAYGFFAELLNEQLKDIRYIGLDVAEEAITYGREVLNQHLICADYLSYPAAEYSDIFMWDVIEHLPRPDLFLQKTASEQKPGGRIYITTGDIAAWVPSFQKEKWRMIHPPSHLQYFSKRTLTALLNKYGYHVVELSYPSVYRSARQIFYSLFMLNKKYGKITEKFYSMIPEKLAIPFNSFDIMFVIAEKK